LSPLRPALHPPAAGPARQLGSGRRAAGVRGRDGPGLRGRRRV